MATDRELLEAAAKAAGFDSVIEMYGFNEFGEPLLDGNEPPTVWNPLTDDGDALRLMVKLNADVTQHSDDLPTCVAVTIIRPDSAAPADYAHIVELHGNCPYAATRRAIVRAAAEIGRNMK
jgi:hypothetical protein